MTLKEQFEKDSIYKFDKLKDHENLKDADWNLVYEIQQYYNARVSWLENLVNEKDKEIKSLKEDFNNYVLNTRKFVKENMGEN